MRKRKNLNPNISFFFKECRTLTNPDEDLQISPMARSRDIFLFIYQLLMGKRKSIFLN